MIKVTVTKDRITIRGHADVYGDEAGVQVCAAVSVLVATLVNLKGGKASSGYAMFKRSRSPHIAFLLKGLRLLAESYPKHIQIDER